MKKIMVVVAHPDDEVLGIGATIRKSVDNGDSAYALILGEGQTSRWASREDANIDVVSELHNDSMASGKIIGYKTLYFENLPDNRFDSVDLLEIVKIVEKYINKIKPDVIYTHHSGDLNIDHRLTYQAVLTATRPMIECCVKEIYGFETVSSTEWQFGNREYSFLPNVFVDVSDKMDYKIEAMKQYKTELCEYPHPRSIEMLEALASVRGATIGATKAEAFETIRIVR